MEICNILGEIIFLYLGKVNKIIHAYTFIDVLHTGKISARNQDSRGQQYMNRFFAGLQEIIPIAISFLL